MKYLLFLLFVVTCEGVDAPPKMQSFCQKDRCMTCVGRYCSVTCRGEDCRSCPAGNCCNGENCNICRGILCCETAECNTCLHTCIDGCTATSNTCHNDCFKSCEDTLPKTPQGSYGPIISNYNYAPVNVTTIINITNTINNTNTVYNPVIVNTTNENNYNHTHAKKIYIKQNVSEDKRKTLENKHNCCTIVHPEICQNVENQKEQLCYTGRHKECSALCSSHYLHIVEDEAQNKTCVNIASPPYFFCGTYSLERCDDCYSCTKKDCGERICPDKCLNAFLPNSYYNSLYRKPESR